MWDDALADPAVAGHVDELADWLAGSVPSGTVVADLGCGTGNHGRALAERGLRVVGVDRSPGMLGQAATKPGLAGRLVRADLGAAPLRVGAVSAAISVYAVQFFTLDEFVATIAALLRPGGVVLIEGPTGGRRRRHRDRSWRFAATQVVRDVAAFAGRRTGHVRHITADALRTSLEAGGFGILGTRTSERSVAMLASRS